MKAAARMTMTDRLMGYVGVLGDYSVIILLLIAVAMMIVPLPPLVVDILIALNIAVTALVLMLAMNINRAVEFATLPSVILVVTVFRMSIEIATSRSILVTADAGHIVQAFGEFVIGGNLIAGVVIFMIVTVVQFLVITKGSERVAEVGARFTLDAMPGKQLAIDNDLRNGDITQAEAVKLRRMLAQENQLYGAMDGAMKFVKGDAMAGMAIVVINLVGGIIIGVVQHKMSFGDAARTFSLMTVGAGLISQIPALFMSIASGSILTRVTGGEGSIGAEISKEFAKPKALAAAAVILGMMTLVPHFPVIVFGTLAAAMGGLAWLAQKFAGGQDGDEAGQPGTARLITTGAKPRAGGAGAGKSGPTTSVPVELRLGRVLLESLDDLSLRLADAAETLGDQLGIAFPMVRINDDPTLAETGYAILIDHLPVARGVLPARRVRAQAKPLDIDVLDLTHELVPGPTSTAPQELWVDESGSETLTRAEIKWTSAIPVLVERVSATLGRNAAQFVGIQEAKNLLVSMEAAKFEDLVREASRAVPLQRFTDVLKRLADEQVSIRNRRLILESLVEWGPKEQDPALLAEYVRGSLRRQISNAHADTDKMIAAILLKRETEDMIRQALRTTAVGTYLTLGDAEAGRLLEQIRVQRPADPIGGPRVVILSSLDIRRHLRAFLCRNEIEIPVLSFQDIAQDYAVRPIATISLPGPSPVRQSAA